MASVKILNKLCGQIQAGATYEDNAMIKLPFVSNRVNTSYDPIEDESVSGEGFKDIPQQGGRHVGVSGMSLQLDKISCIPIFEAAFGNNSTRVFTLGGNAKKMSLCMLDSVNAVKYANMFLGSLTLSGSANQKLMLSADLIGASIEDRAATSAYPSDTPYDLPFVFQEMGGSNGYVRVGDASDALVADNIKIEDFSIQIGSSFGEQFTNDGRGIETPVFGQEGFPEISGSFTVASHTTDQWLQWEEDHTPLQMALLAYKDATATVLIEIPRFVATVELTDDDKTKVKVDMKIGRNGTGTSYRNATMAFTSPVRVTVVNS